MREEPSQYKHAELQVCVLEPMSVHLQYALGEEEEEDGWRRLQSLQRRRLRHTSKARVGVGHRAEGILRLTPSRCGSLPSTTYPHVQRRPDPDPDPGDLHHPSPLSQGSLVYVPSF